MTIPTTIRLGVTTWDEDIRRSPARIIGIFARDPESYAVLQACGLKQEIVTGLSHEPALYLRGSELLRLHHSAATEEFVLAALLGKPTFAYPTAYGKLEAIYAHSVKDRAHVDFVDGTAPAEEPESRPGAGAPRTEMCRQAV